MGRTIILGDIHACSDEVEALFNKVGLNLDDTVYAIGDIFDRGPSNSKILAQFSQGVQFFSIKGNHERKHLLIRDGKCRASLSQELTKKELGEDYPKLLEYVEKLPNYLGLDGAILVHGALEPGIPLPEQKEHVLVSSISGQRHLEKNYPKPWYELADFGKPIIFGHKVYERPFVYNNRVFGIDTGCCNGKSLTAIVLPEFKLYSVKARRDYWGEKKGSKQELM